MNDMNRFRIPDELLEGANGGTGFSYQGGENAEKLEQGFCFQCGTELLKLADSSNGNATRACPKCGTVFQRIAYMDGTFVWGILKV